MACNGKPPPEDNGGGAWCKLLCALRERGKLPIDPPPPPPEEVLSRSIFFSLEEVKSRESSQLTIHKKRNLEGESFSLSGLSLLIILIIHEKKKKREKIKERGSLLLVWFQQIGACCDRGQYVYIHREKRD